MAKKTTTVAVSGILIVALVAGLLFYQPFGGQVPSSAGCPSGMVVKTVSNSGSGALSVTCASGGGASYTYATCTSGQYVYGNRSTGFLCSQISYSQLAGALYFTCPTGQYSYGNQSSGLKCSAVAYSQLSGSLSCSSGYALVEVSTVATCLPFAGTESAARTLYVDLTNGNDATCTGTSSSPCKTIGGACDLLPPVINYATTIDVWDGNDTETLSSCFSSLIITASLTIQADSPTLGNLYFNGEASSGSSNTIVDSSASWTTNEFQGGRVWIYEWPTADASYPPQLVEIASNTATTITIDGTWTNAPVSGAYFAVGSGVQFQSSTTGYVFTINGQAKSVNLYGFGFYNSGDGAEYENGAVGNFEYDYGLTPNGATFLASVQGGGLGVIYEYDYCQLDGGGTSTATCVVAQTGFTQPRASVFSSVSPADRVGMECTRVGYCSDTTAAGLLDLFYGLSVGVEVYDTSGLLLLTSQIFINCQTNIESPALVGPNPGKPIPFYLLADYPSTANAQSWTFLTGTTADAIDYTPLAQTGTYTLAISVCVGAIVGGGCVPGNPVACIFCSITLNLQFEDAASSAQNLNLACQPLSPASSATTTATTTTTIGYTSTVYFVTHSTTTIVYTWPATTYSTTSTFTSTTKTSTTTVASTTSTVQVQTSYAAQPLVSPITSPGLYSCSYTFSVDASATPIVLSVNTVGKVSYVISGQVGWNY